jgi:hypothetical protein
MFAHGGYFSEVYQTGRSSRALDRLSREATQPMAT